MLNRMILFVFVLHVASVGTSAALAALFEASGPLPRPVASARWTDSLWRQVRLAHAWYLMLQASPAAAAGVGILSYAVLYNTMIPISLYVSIEIVRVAQALFIQWDNKCVSYPDTPDEQRVIVRNSNLNEELGQVPLSPVCVFGC
jgi:magnesium-transporting ATPase (P-type)